MIKVEPPAGGDSSRANGPFPLGDGGGRTPGPDMESSALFLYLNAGKLGVTLNIATSTGRDLLLRMLEDADVLVENYPGARMRELGLDYPSLEDRFPRLVVTSITPFGHTGPYADYAAYDLNVQAAGGVSIGAGMPDREPLAIPYSQADYLAGLAGAASTLLALLARDATGRGQAVDVAASQVLAVLISSTYFLPNFIYRGVAGTRKGTRGGEAYFPNTIMRCKDGFVCLYPLRIEQYIRFLELIGSPEWQEEPRYRNRRAMAEEYPRRGRGPDSSLVSGAHQGGDLQGLPGAQGALRPRQHHRRRGEQRAPAGAGVLRGYSPPRGRHPAPSGLPLPPLPDAGAPRRPGAAPGPAQSGGPLRQAGHPGRRFGATEDGGSGVI